MSLLKTLFAALTPKVTLSGHSISAAEPAGSTASVRVNTDGTVDQGVNGVFSGIDVATDWIRPTAAASSNYEVRATVTAGSLDSGTVGTWLAIDDNRTFGVIATSGNTASATITLEIRIGTTVLASNAYTLSADATP